MLALCGALGCALVYSVGGVRWDLLWALLWIVLWCAVEKVVLENVCSGVWVAVVCSFVLGGFG